MGIEAVLAGQDGQTPAIDQATGRPLTMEELLRRRGMLVSSGLHSIYPMQDQAAASAGAGQAGGGVTSAASGNATAAALAARAGASGGGAALGGGLDPTSTYNPNMQDASTPNADSGGIDLPPWLIGAPVAAILAYRAWKARNGGVDPTMEPGAKAQPAFGADDISNADSKSVVAKGRPVVNRGEIKGSSVTSSTLAQRRIEGPRKQIGDNRKQPGRTPASQMILENPPQQKLLEGPVDDSGVAATLARRARGGVKSAGKAARAIAGKVIR